MRLALAASRLDRVAFQGNVRPEDCQQKNPLDSVLSGAALVAVCSRRVPHNHPVCRKHHAETTATAGLAADFQLGPVAIDHMFDNRKTQSSTAGFARAAPIDTIKTLSKPRQVLWLDANPRVTY